MHESAGDSGGPAVGGVTDARCHAGGHGEAGSHPRATVVTVIEGGGLRSDENGAPYV